jgi:hypothetical protein
MIPICLCKNKMMYAFTYLRGGLQRVKFHHGLNNVVPLEANNLFYLKII